MINWVTVVVTALVDGWKGYLCEDMLLDLRQPEARPTCYLLFDRSITILIKRIFVVVDLQVGGWRGHLYISMHSSVHHENLYTDAT